MHEPERSVPHDLQAVLDAAVKRLRAAGTDLQSVEVKRAAGGLPHSVLESVCAFANARGGLLVLGLTDGDFRPVGIDAVRLASDLASACSEGLVPATRPEVDIALVDSRPVVVARVDPLEHRQRPCYLKARGMQGGVFLRTHDGDRRLNSYEVHVMVSGRGQPADDTAAVEGAGIEHLDEQLTADLLRRLRSTRGPVFAQASDAEILHMTGVCAEPSADSAVTLASLLALGRYPQQFFPQLSASFVALPSEDGEPTADGTRFLDNQPIDGPIPLIVSAALDALHRNMRRRAVVVGAGRQDVWEYPHEAAREVIANALMHRDYHPSAHGSPARVRLFPDRLEVSSIGGLHGPNAGLTDPAELIDRGVTATRNARLAKLLEDVVIPGTGRPVCENRGSGLRAAAAALRHAGMRPLRLVDTVNELRVVIEAPDWVRPAVGSPAATPASRPLSASRAPEMRFSTAPSANRGLRSRERQILELLADGPRSSSELASAAAVSRQAMLKWLNRMADSGLVRRTELNRRSRHNRWELAANQPASSAHDPQRA